ncbi:MAG: asparaginase [Gemmatimonadales bacterium]
MFRLSCAPMTEMMVVSTRGTLDESVHHLSAAIVVADGRIVGSAGNPRLVTFWRSAAKPFQLLPLVADGGVERFGLDAAMIAIACGSHNAESIHREVIARWLAAIGASEADLACGGHPSLWPALADAMVHDEIQPTPIWSNCSGNHAALLASARLHDWGISGYEERSHPVQQRVAETIATWSGVASESLLWGVDGCTAAAVALELRAMATAYVRLAISPDAAASTIRNAMMSEPYLVAGADRLDTVVMQAWPGRIFAKIGADGVYSAALPTLGLGLALKIHDGQMAAAEVALVGLLEAVIHRFGGSEPWPFEPLGQWREPAIRNTRGTTTGRLELRGDVTWA